MITMIFQLIISLGVIPAFGYWLLKRLTRSKIAISTRQYKEKSKASKNAESLFITRILVQNQQDAHIPGNVHIQIPLSEQEWDSEKGISIIHGPTVDGARKPQVRFLENNTCEITVEKGMRPLMTWLIICRTKNRYPEKLTLNLPSDPGFRQRTFDLNREVPVIEPEKFYNRKNRLRLWIWSVLPLLFFAPFITNLEKFLDMTLYKKLLHLDFLAFWNILDKYDGILVFAILLMVFFTYIAFEMGEIKSPSLTQGYVDEDDPLSTTDAGPPKREGQ